MDDRSRREEEERREAEERRREESRSGAGGRRGENLFDEELFGSLESGLGRGSRSRRGSPEDSNQVQDRVQDRDPAPDPGGPDRGRRRGPIRGQSRGLYGSQVGSNMLRSAVAELVGTFVLVFTGTAVAVAAILQRSTVGPLGFYDSLAVALAFGLALVALVAAIGHVSGAHVNPAVTLGLAATNKFPWEYVPVYVGAQFLGGILGAVGTWIAYGSAAREVALLATTFPPEDVGDLRALVVEILITFILVFVVISVATDDRVPAGVAPLAVGFALACGVLIAGPVTGGSVNPARTLGPALVAGHFDAIWVYIVGPIAGGVLAALLYDNFISEAETPD